MSEIEKFKNKEKNLSDQTEVIRSLKILLMYF